MNKTPVLLAYLREDAGGLKVWCPFCRRWHLHGWGFGHRSAHCDQIDGPFQATGYKLKAASRTVSKAVKDAEMKQANQKS